MYTHTLHAAHVCTVHVFKQTVNNSVNHTSTSGTCTGTRVTCNIKNICGHILYVTMRRVHTCLSTLPLTPRTFHSSVRACILHVLPVVGTDTLTQ